MSKKKRRTVMIVSSFALALALAVKFIFVGAASGPLQLLDHFEEQPGLHFTIVLEPGFEGWLRLVDDPGLPIDYERQYEIVQDGDTLAVPGGSIYGHVHHIVEIRYEDGTVLTDHGYLQSGEYGVIGNLDGDHPDFEERGQYWLFGIQTTNDNDWDADFDEPRYDISAILGGLHWVDGREGDLKQLERGFFALGDIPPDELRLSVLDYLYIYHDSGGAQYRLKDKDVIYRRNIDIAVLNRYYVSSLVPLNWDDRWGDTSVFGEYYPWGLYSGKKKLLISTVPFDSAAEKKYDAWGEFQTVLRMAEIENDNDNSSHPLRRRGPG